MEGGKNMDQDFRNVPRTSQKIVAQAHKDVYLDDKFIGVWEYSKWDDGIVTVKLPRDPFHRYLVTDPEALEVTWIETGKIRPAQI